MATKAELQAQLDRLRAIRAKGVRSYEINGRRIEYRNDADLEKAIADLEARIAAADGRRVKMVRISSSKGL